MLNIKLSNGFYTNVCRHMNTLCYRGRDENGKKIYERIRYKPTAYLPSKNQNSKFTAVDGIKVEPMEFESMSALRQFQSDYKGISEYKVYGNTKHIPALIQKIFPNKIRYNRDLIDVGNLDIETSFYADSGLKTFPDPDNPQNQIYTLAYKSSLTDEYHLWGTKDYDPKDTTHTTLKRVYHKCKNEEDLLANFIDYFANDYPDVLTGWNSNAFDLPYLAARSAYILGEKHASKLSPWNILKRRETFIKGKKVVFFDYEGIACLDYMDLFKKFCLLTYGQQESYALDHVAHVVLDRKKIDYSEVANLEELYAEDFQKYLSYNAVDVELLELFEDKLSLISLIVMLAYKAGVNYTDCLGTTAYWDSMIFRDLQKKKVIIDNPERFGGEKFPGGYVTELVPGKYEWVICFDLSSLYPSIMRQYNMSFDTKTRIKVPGICPDTLIDHLNGKIKLDIPEDVAMAANGICFRKDKHGTIPEILTGLYNERIDIKDRQLDTEVEYEKSKDPALGKIIANCETAQMAIKTSMNSCFGAQGNGYFRYYDHDIASAITLTGQAIVKYSAQIINETVSKFLGEEDEYSIYSDTDSVYVCCEKVMNKYNPKNPVKFLNDFAKKIVEPALNKAYKHFSDETGAYEETLKMDMELICTSAIWVAGKNYILNVIQKDKTVYDNPKIKMKGIAAVKSSTPQFCRDKLKESFEVIMNGTEADVQKFIKKVKKEFITLPPHEIAFPRSINDIRTHVQRDGWYGSKKPSMHVRAAIVHNWYVKLLQLDQDIRMIDNGDKMKFIHLKSPNPVRHENVIAFSRFMPKEFKLEPFIDKDLQFKKTFSDNLKAILDPIGWDIEPKADLSDFF
jgi:DNA polymerase elongation subunit (family B)